MDTITLQNPLDMHVHFRESEMLKVVAPLTAEHFSGALVMPNTQRIINSFERVGQYRTDIAIAVQPHEFTPYMTLYFSTDYDYKSLQEIKPHILAIKFYSQGMTTNSEHGTDPDDISVLSVLGHMEELDIPLCVHAEAHGYWLDREQNFYVYLTSWTRRYPRLKIIIEHITDAMTLRMIQDFPNLYGTVTPHHLLLTTDDVIGDTLRPHLFCKPLMKRPSDRRALCDTVFSGPERIQRKLMLGTDSAPHDESNKLKDCGCAGIFTAPIALQLLAEDFHRYSYQEKFQDFVSGNAQRIYGIEPIHKKTVTLVRKPFIIPARYGKVVPMWAGQKIQWSIDDGSGNRQ